MIGSESYPHPLALDVGEMKVHAYPIDFNNHLGSHDYFVKACVSVEGTLKSCMQSNQGTVNVIDPCLTTSVQTEAITSELIAARLATDSISLPLEFINWPFIDSVSASTSLASTAFLKCGTTTYSVVDGNGNSPGFVYYD